MDSPVTPKSRDSDLLSRSSVRSMAFITAKIQAAEAVKVELREKRDRFRQQTSLKTAELNQQIGQLRSTLAALSEHYAALKQQAMELSKPHSSRELNNLSSSLEQKLEEKKQLAQQKLLVVRESQRLVQSIQQLALEKKKIEKQFNNEVPIRTLREKLELIKARTAKYSQPSTGTTAEVYQMKLEELRQDESALKTQLQTEYKAINESKQQIGELEDILRTNSKQLTKFHGQIQEERSKNEEREKRIQIVETEIKEVQALIQSITDEINPNQNTIMQLTEGIEHLSQFLQSIKKDHQNIRANNSKLLTNLKNSLQQLDQLEIVFRNNSVEVEKLGNSYNQIMDPIISSSRP